jgi:hypothetical protein
MSNAVLKPARDFSTCESTAKRSEGVSGVGVTTATVSVRRRRCHASETLQLRADTETAGCLIRVATLKAGHCHLVGAMLRERQSLGCRKQRDQQATSLRPSQLSKPATT